MSSGFIWATAAAVTWGLVYAIDQKILNGLSPFALLFVDSILTAVLLLPFIFIEKNSLVALAEVPAKTWLLVIASLALAALANFFIFSSIKIIGASTASVFEIAYPFFVVAFAYLFFRETPTVYFALGGLLIFAGAAIIVLKS